MNILWSRLISNVLRGFHRKFCSEKIQHCSLVDVFEGKVQVGNTILVKGWIKSVRKMKETTFLDIGDGSCTKHLQVVLSKYFQSPDITTGSSMTVTGHLKQTQKNQLELSAEAVEVLGKCVVTEGYPFAPRKHYATDYVRQYLHFRPRTNMFSSLLRIRDKTTFEIHSHLHDEGFLNIHTPILTSNDCEGAGELFKIHPMDEHISKSMMKEGLSRDEAYFDKKVFLTVSGQLHLEIAAHGLSKVYTFGPTFRAENSRSRLHLSEFYMLEAEIAFIEHIEDLITVVEKLIKKVTSDIMNKCGDDLRKCNEHRCEMSWIDKEFKVMTYNEAANVLQKNCDKCDSSVSKWKGLTKQQELFLVDYCGGIPVFIVKWPKEMKPFYMKECENDQLLVDALDLLVPNVGEVVGGSLRENHYDKLKNRIPNNMDWYLDLRKFGSVPTGGFGMGFERYLQFITGIENIKDTIPFPRWPHNCHM